MTFDGTLAWLAAGDRIQSLDPESGEPGRSLAVPADAGTAFDGRYLFQLTSDRIQNIEPETGRVVGTIPAPGKGSDSGLAWAEGSLWVGQYRRRKIDQIIRIPATSSEPSNRIGSSPASRGSTASSGMGRGKKTRASSDESTLNQALCSNGSPCRKAQGSAGWSPMAVTHSSAAAERAEKCGGYAARSGMIQRDRYRPRVHRSAGMT